MPMWCLSHREAKTSHLIFSKIWILQQKIWKFWQNMGSQCWVVDTASCVFSVINALAVALLFLRCMITKRFENVLRQMKNFFVELMNWLTHFIRQSIDWYDVMGWQGVWLIHFLLSSLFSGENCIWSSCFLLITEWFNLGVIHIWRPLWGGKGLR